MNKNSRQIPKGKPTSFTSKTTNYLQAGTLKIAKNNAKPVKVSSK